MFSVHRINASALPGGGANKVGTGGYDASCGYRADGCGRKRGCSHLHLGVLRYVVKLLC